VRLVSFPTVFRLRHGITLRFRRILRFTPCFTEVLPYLCASCTIFHAGQMGSFAVAIVAHYASYPVRKVVRWYSPRFCLYPWRHARSCYPGTRPNAPAISVREQFTGVMQTVNW